MCHGGYKGGGGEALQLYPGNTRRMVQTQSFSEAIQKTRLEELHKIIFYNRFLSVLEEFEVRSYRLSILFHVLRILVSIGSLIVPALLSIQYSDTSNSTTIKDPDSFAYEIYWATWVISLLVTTSNGILTVFKIDKKYYFLHTTKEQLRSEGWQYLELSGRYSGFHTPGTHPTHENQFIYFCHAIEKIKMHQVEEEYFKLTEPASQVQTTQSGDSKTDKKENPLIHPTPQASLDEVANNLPPELRRQLLSMVVVDGGPHQTETDADAQTKGSDEETEAREARPSVSVSRELHKTSSPQQLLV